VHVVFPETVHGELLTRATAAEGAIEALFVKVATERILEDDDVRALGLFRQAYQKLREAIRDGQELEWTHGTPEYRLYNELACKCSRIISHNRYYPGGFFQRDDAEKPHEVLEKITSIRSTDWIAEVGKHQPAGAGPPPVTAPPQYFRAGVGAVILNHEGLTLALERCDTAGAWQLPQGGLEQNEEAVDALFREIEEETSIQKSDLELLVAQPELLVYELPAAMRSSKTGRGQVQSWFVLRYHGGDAKIDIASGGEFRAWQWMPFDRLLGLVVDFRKPVYHQLAVRFRNYLASDGRRAAPEIAGSDAGQSPLT
jgi:putative (di)nucleoside polyphosphate hydrolase